MLQREVPLLLGPCLPTEKDMGYAMATIAAVDSVKYSSCHIHGMVICIIAPLDFFYPFAFVARESATGKLINEYLEKKSELDDHVVHLLFSANRWEAV